MSSKLAINQQELNRTSPKLDMTQFSCRTYLTTDRVVKSRFESSFMIDQENAKELQKIQKRAQQLKQKEKRERNILKKLRKIYELQLKEFQALNKVTKQALQQKSKEVQMLSMENNQLKEQHIQFSTLKGEKQTLALINQQLQKQNEKLFLQLSTFKQNYQSLKVQFEQQSELLDKGIRQNQIQSESPIFTIPESLKQVQQLKRDIEQQQQKELDTTLKKDEENLRAQTQQINNCNFMLMNLLKQIKKTQNGQQNKDQVFEDNIGKSLHKLMSLTEELMKKTDELSQAFGKSQKLQKDLKQRQVELCNLTQKLKQQRQLCQSREIQIQNCKQQIEIYQDSQKMRFQTQLQNKEKQTKNFQKFQEQLHKLLQDKKLKQYSTVYETFSKTSNQIFRAWNFNKGTLNNSSDKFIENVMNIIEANLIKLNDNFRQKANRDIERIQKMVGFIQNANNVIQKQNQNEDYIQEDQDRNIFIESTPQKFSIQLNNRGHSRQQSESSARSVKKSIVLEEDMDNAINYDEEMDRLKQESLQQELSNMRNSQVILDSLNQESQKSDTIKDVISESSFSKSKISELSQAQQTRVYNDRKKSALLNAKLKKKRHQKQ